jgi:hypothetical protein
MIAATAVCTWQTVRLGFFPPEVLSDLGQEQVTHRTEDQMALQAEVAATFVMIQAELAFFVLETAFDAPTR